MSLTVKVTGTENFRAALLRVAEVVRRREAAKALRAGANVVKKKTAQAAPVLEAAIYRKGKLIRKPGTVRDAIKVRSSRITNRTGNVGVFVNVKPAKGGARGAQSPSDPYYWKWLSFGTRTMAARPFVQTGAEALADGTALAAIETSMAASIDRLKNGA